jgi:hypothetical protein
MTGSDGLGGLAQLDRLRWVVVRMQRRAPDFITNNEIVGRGLCTSQSSPKCPYEALQNHSRLNPKKTRMHRLAAAGVPPFCFKSIAPVKLSILLKFETCS